MSPDNTPILNVSKLVKRFGGFYALDGLSFHVSSGEILGLVGPNGSGKTTAINVISGLYAPDGGEVALDGGSIGAVGIEVLPIRPANDKMIARKGGTHVAPRSMRTLISIVCLGVL